MAESFPLFPLGLVLLPSEVIPLHIFEERYKTMIGECVDEEKPFGILWLADDGLRETGCTAAVTQVMEQMEDGRSNILVQGGQVFRMLRRIDHLAYPAGDVELLEDAGGDPDEEVAAEAREGYADLVERVTDTRSGPGEVAVLDAYQMAATIDFAPDAKQELLELRTEDERMRSLAALFEQTMRRIDYMERAGERARSNGKVRF